VFSFGLSVRVFLIALSPYICIFSHPLSLSLFLSLSLSLSLSFSLSLSLSLSLSYSLSLSVTLLGGVYKSCGHC
jgi:hypothetical protein